MSLQGTEKRVEKYGHTWKWREPNGDMRGHWESTEGNLVMIFPPNAQIDYWSILEDHEVTHKFSGDDAEERAFSVAEAFTRQPLS